MCLSRMPASIERSLKLVVCLLEWLSLLNQDKKVQLIVIPDLIQGEKSLNPALTCRVFVAKLWLIAARVHLGA
jgi:hypothetical protein